MAEIIFRNVTKSFGTEPESVKNISFEVDKGEFVFLVGRSGAGKSTILKLLTTQLVPTAGEITVDDESIIHVKKSRIPYFRRKFGIMEEKLGLLNDRTLYDNIALAMIATNQPKKLINGRVEEVLGVVGLRKMKTHYPYELSGGEKARALLARALVTNPHIIVADEPTANLDPDASWDLMCLLDDISHQGFTVIVASHARELVTIMKKRVITLADGEIIKDEKKGRYDMRLIEIYERMNDKDRLQ
ncbi:MAG: ATP-binding cassette domain-containing protein [Lachnospiraceae bacterium]|nr:ATP-binding cassette domain-containing protein [Lachnospiraceae bacterium]